MFIDVYYTILDTIEVPDDTTDSEIDKITDDYGRNSGFLELVNDKEWHIKRDSHRNLGE